MIFIKQAELSHRGKMFMCLRWERVTQWRKTYRSCTDEMSRGQTVGEWLIMEECFGLIGSKSVHWGQLLWEQNDDQHRTQTIHLPAGRPLILIIPLHKCSSFCIPQSSLTLITSLVRLAKPEPIFLSFFPIFTSFYSLCCLSCQWCWIIDGVLSW